MINPVLTWQSRVLAGSLLASLILLDVLAAEVAGNRQSGDTWRLEYTSVFDLSDAPAPGTEAADKRVRASDTRSSPASTPKPEASEPAPSVAPPTLHYSSALDSYDRYEESPDPEWVKANQEVGKIGGWQAYAREMYEAGKAREAARKKASLATNP